MKLKLTGEKKLYIRKSPARATTVPTGVPHIRFIILYSSKMLFLSSIQF